MAPPEPGPWPAVSVADTRGILRREPLTPPVARAIRETLAARRRVFLGVSRLTSSLACDECGTVVRCAGCSIAFAYSRASARLVCRLCGAAQPLPDTCAACQGRRLSPFGWGAERVEHAVRRRFPAARIARWDPDAVRGARGEAQRAAAAAADVVIGTRGALRLFGPASLGLAAFVAPDQLLRAPDFRAAERTLGLVWAAAERVGGRRRPDHPVAESRALRVRGGRGPGSRRVLPTRAGISRRARLSAVQAPRHRHHARGRRRRHAPAGRDGRRRAARAHRAHRLSAGGRGKGPRPADRREGRRRAAAPARGRAREFRTPRPASRGIIDVEVDPVEWPF